MQAESSFSPPPLSWLRPLWFWLAAAVLVGLRFLHFGESVDEPHSWRQCDTAEYAYSLYTGQSSLLSPEVNWMGGHPTILEFPLHEALTALLYRIFWPAHAWGRLVTLLFFIGSAAYLHRIVRMLTNPLHAQLATLIYLAMPLGLFYSRALHIDFVAVCLAHGMLYHWMQAVRTRQWAHWVAGCLHACLAFPVKAPYAFYLALPLLAFILHERAFLHALRRSYFLLLPLVVFAVWQRHVDHVNASVPDLSHLMRDYHPFTKEWTYKWYFGTWQQRTLLENWEMIWLRIQDEVVGGAMWVWLLPPALLIRPLRFGHNFFRLWMLGAVAYVALFFNLNWVHNYYQIPMMAITAILLGSLLTEVAEAVGQLWPRLAAVAVGAVMLLYGAQQVRYAERHYYQQEPLFASVGRYVQQFTPVGAKVILAKEGTDARTPMYLYHAHRQGWQIEGTRLTAELVKGLHQAGATHLVILATQPVPMPVVECLATCPRRHRVLRPDMGLLVYDLSPLTAAGS